MTKITKKILIVIVPLIIIFLTVYIAHSLPFRIIPYPYKLAKTFDKDASEAQNAQVLIVGDRMGLKLNNFMEKLITKTSNNLAHPVRIFNWSRNHEGLHRTLSKLKSLTKLPPIIVYHGASEELFEKKFFIDDRKTIIQNFKNYKDPNLNLLMSLFPISSLFYYSSPHFIKLGKEIKEDMDFYTVSKKQTQMELSYLLFKTELKELASIIKEKKRTLILLTTPLKLDVLPGKTCANSTTDKIIKVQKELEALLNSGDFKLSYERLKKLSSVTLGNAKSYYLFGLAATKLGRYFEARSILEYTTALDCNSWRGNMIYNKLIKKVAHQSKFPLIDFHSIVNINYGTKSPYHDQEHIYPRKIFYQHLVDKLGSVINKLL